MSTASAAVIGLTFEGIGNDEQILDFYGDGTDYLAAGGNGTPGDDLGVVFNEFAQVKIDVDSVTSIGDGNFANEPSPDSVLFWATAGASAILDFAAGFDTGFSFFYTAAAAGAVTVWSEVGGEGGGGDRLATLNLVANSTDNACTGDPNPDGSPEPVNFCNWDAIGVPLMLEAGQLAKSIDFSGAADLIAFDNVTFGAVNPVPLPAGVWLLASGLLGFAAFRRRGRSAG